jgi:hypothetical protein
VLSTGNVIIPTIIREVENAAITLYETPLSYNIEQSGYTIGPGITVIDPIVKAVKIAKYDLVSPRYLTIVSLGSKYKTIDTATIIETNGGVIFHSFFAPILKAFFVFLELIKNEIVTEIIVKIYINSKILILLF